MRTVKIVTDSSSDVLSLSCVDFAFAPLHIITATREFVDNANLDVADMADFLARYKGRAHTSCPNPQDWLAAFSDADDIFCVTMTSAMSGTHNAACLAARLYESQNPGRRVFILDSLSTGPEMRLLIEKLEELIASGREYEDICREIRAYKEKTSIVFMLKSMHNLANSGRVSPIVARIAGLVGIHVIGQASEKGTLEPIDKCRGETRALASMLKTVEKSGFSRGKIYIAHSRNEEGALRMKNSILEKFPEATVEVYPCRGLCSFFAEEGGMLIGYEKF